MQLCFHKVFNWKLLNSCRCITQTFRRDLNTDYNLSSILYVTVCRGTNLALNKKRPSLTYYFFSLFRFTVGVE